METKEAMYVIRDRTDNTYWGEESWVDELTEARCNRSSAVLNIKPSEGPWRGDRAL